MQASESMQRGGGFQLQNFMYIWFNLQNTVRYRLSPHSVILILSWVSWMWPSKSTSRRWRERWSLCSRALEPERASWETRGRSSQTETWRSGAVTGLEGKTCEKVNSPFKNVEWHIFWSFQGDFLTETGCVMTWTKCNGQWLVGSQQDCVLNYICVRGFQCNI